MIISLSRGILFLQLVDGSFIDFYDNAVSDNTRILESAFTLQISKSKAGFS